jgi:hypothetical protein
VPLAAVGNRRVPRLAWVDKQQLNRSSQFDSLGNMKAYLTPLQVTSAPPILLPYSHVSVESQLQKHIAFSCSVYDAFIMDNKVISGVELRSQSCVKTVLISVYLLIYLPVLVMLCDSFVK